MSQLILRREIEPHLARVSEKSRLLRRVLFQWDRFAVGIQIGQFGDPVQLITQVSPGEVFEAFRFIMNSICLGICLHDQVLLPQSVRSNQLARRSRPESVNR